MNAKVHAVWAQWQADNSKREQVVAAQVKRLLKMKKKRGKA